MSLASTAGVVRPLSVDSVSTERDDKPPGIEVVGVSKRFRTVQALDGVSLTVPVGAVTALVGRNGAGKSTLIKILATSVRPDSGAAFLHGHEVSADPMGARKQFGLALGEDRSFFWRLNGRQNLEFFARLYGLRRRDARLRVTQVLHAVDLAEVAERRVDRYSTGMRSRLGMARALLGSPRVLLLDEPTRSLDPAASTSLRELVAALVQTRRSSVLLATHDMDEAVQLSDEVVVLRSGTVAARFGPPFDTGRIEAAIRGAP